MQRLDAVRRRRVQKVRNGEKVVALICRVCKNVVVCREVPYKLGYYECPYGHGQWAEDDPE